MKEAFTSGATEIDACEYAGIGYRTYERWKSKGEGGKSEYGQFWQNTQTWRSEGRIRLRDVIYAAAESGDWKAADRMLEKIDPTWRNPPQALEITINDPDQEKEGRVSKIDVELLNLFERHPDVKWEWLKILEDFRADEDNHSELRIHQRMR